MIPNMKSKRKPAKNKFNIRANHVSLNCVTFVRKALATIEQILMTLLNPQLDEYHLILANIRDEYYSRPTEICSFWDNQTNLIGGKDLQKGREGGTWLAMNTNGKIGVLLNILQPDIEISADRKSRGPLVVDYLKGNYSPLSYLEEISRHAIDYNGFKMIAMHIKPNNGTESAFFSHSDDRAITLSPGIYALGNNKSDTLWPKVSKGKVRFEDLVNKYSKTSSKSQLIDGIFELLSDKTVYPLDEQMKSQGKGIPNDRLQKLNALNVEIPQVGYGSRTRSIILVDGQLNVDYIEKTMKEPIDTNEKIEWITTKKHFKINN